MVTTPPAQRPKVPTQATIAAMAHLSGITTEQMERAYRQSVDFALPTSYVTPASTTRRPPHVRNDHRPDGDFLFNRRPYNNDRYNTNSANTNNAAYYNNLDSDDEHINVDNEPDTHRCGVFLVLLLCPPIGILAMYHSIMVTRCWDKSQEQSQEQEKSNSSNEPQRQRQRQRQEELAQGHSNSTGLYVFVGTTLGLLFWMYYLWNDGSILQYYFPPPTY